jgi:threonine 3-dehydrogenase
MKALVKARAEPGIWLQDVPEPSVGHNEVLIKVHRSAICGTDMHIYNWDAWAQKTVPVPMTVALARHCGARHIVIADVND